MRKKLFIGVMMFTLLGVAVGGHFFARTNAQDPAKKAEPTKKGDSDLFDTLKQALEQKSGAPTIPPPLAPPPPVQVQPPIVKPAEIGATFPPLSKDPAPSFPPLTPKDSAPVVAKEPLPALPPSTNPPPLVIPRDVAPGVPPAVVGGTQPMQPMAPPPSWTLQPGTPGTAPPIPPQQSPAPPTTRIAPNKIGDDVARVKDCPWTMNVEMINGQTVISATVNKKHEFKIVCQNLDLQTGKGMLKATGNVQITGDMLTGSCDQLGISLLEDRLLLEGGAQVSIQKSAANVSDAAAATFELKGTTLNLRISDLQSAKLLQMGLPMTAQAGLTVTAQPVSSQKVAADGKQWSPYGTLKRANRKQPQAEEIALSHLEDRTGKVIAVLVARDGGSLAQFEGQSISVLGTREQIAGESVLRVTHIALP